MEKLDALEYLLRLSAAFGSGLVIGLERENRGRPAGLRTTILACLAATIAMILSEFLFVQSTGGEAGAWRPDPARLATGILTGIGFLGAGTIWRHENIVRGVTTAATLWFVTVLGLAYGSGAYVLGAMGTVIAFVVLTLLPTLENFLKKDGYAHLLVEGRMSSWDEDEVCARVRSLGAEVKLRKVRYEVAQGLKSLDLEIKVAQPKHASVSKQLVAELTAHPGVETVSWY